MLIPTCKVALVSMFDMAYSHRSVDNHENGTLLHLVSFGILHKTDRGVAFKIRPTRTCQWQVREELGVLMNGLHLVIDKGGGE